jgi:hypothetical protein
MALSVYMIAAAVVWAGCAIAVCVPAWRGPAKRVAVSMLASFPGVVAVQATVFPICMVLALGAGAIAWSFVLLLEPNLSKFGLLAKPIGSLAELLMITLLFASIALFAVASLCGSYLGWTIAWDMTDGVRFRIAVRTNSLVVFGRWRLMRLICRRRRRGRR